MRKSIFTIAALLSACLFISATAPAVQAADTNIVKGGVVIHNTYADFIKGQHEGTSALDKNGGVIELTASAAGVYPSKGTYTSPEIYTEAFEYMVLSWNTDTPGRTSVKIEAQARVNGTWSKWLLVGTWSTSGDKASAMSTDQSSDDIAYVNTDIITVKGTNGETADCFKYRLTLYTENEISTPSVRLVSATLRNTLPGQSIKAVNDGETAITQAEIDAFTGTLDVRAYAQTTRDPQFSSIICSATSTAMILDYKGIHILPEMAAMGVLDSAYDGYGNWPFNAAFIGSYGFESYIQYCQSFDDIKLELIAGNPVICSVRYKRGADIAANLPIISNAPIDSTYGHVLVVVGYERGTDGKSYVVVNDPAAAKDSEVRRLYEESQFLAAWSASGMVAYKVHGLVSGGGSSAPVIEEARLIPTGNARTLDGKTTYEYALIGAKTGLASAAKAVNPHKLSFQTGVSIILWDETANFVHSYIKPTHDAGIWLSDDMLDKAVYLFLKNGNYFKAHIQ